MFLMAINLPTKRISATSQRFLSVLPTRWRRNTADIDMEQNYATVTLCISEVMADKAIRMVAI